MKSYDIIAVLGNGFTKDWQIPLHQKERLKKARDFYRKGLSNSIAVCGKWSINWDRKSITPPTTEAQIMKQELVELQVPSRNILKEEYSKDTIGNAYYLKRHIVLPNKYKKLVILCADYAENRVRFIFQKIYGNKFEISITTTTTPYGKDPTVKKVQDDLLKEQQTFLQDMTDGDETFLSSKLYSDAYYKNEGHPLAAFLTLGGDR